MRVQKEKKIEERKILGPDLRERRRERVREEGNRRQMRHAVLEGQIEGNRFSVKERRRAERIENDSTCSTLAEGRSHRTISEAGKVRGRKTRVEGGESSKTRSRRKRTRSRKSERDAE